MKYPTYFPKITEVKTYVNYKKRPETHYIVVHCSATQNNPEYDWKTIDQMHRAKGWLGIGYHFVIRTDGTIEEGRPLDRLGSHVYGHNSESVGICLIGGVDSKGKSTDNFTFEQKARLLELLDALRTYYKDSVQIVGHHDFNPNKDCPCFNAKDWYTSNTRAKFEVYTGKESTETSLSKHDFELINGTEIALGTVIRVS